MSATYTLGQIKTLSFSRYLRLKRCMLSGAALAWSTSAGVPRPPLQRSQVLGQMFHSIMATLNTSLSGLAATKADFRRCFNTVLGQLAGALQASPSSRFLGNPEVWPEVATLYRTLSAWFDARHVGRASVRARAERTLRSSDGLLWGRPDAYFLHASGIDLVDYKSGALLEAQAPRPAHVDQLYFYAHLLHEVYGSYPRSLALVGSDGLVVEVDPAPTRSADIAADMRATLAAYNARVLAHECCGSVASPSEEACLFCEMKPVCEAFWQTAPSMSLPAWAHVATGRQVGPALRTRMGGVRLDVAVERSSLRAERLTVTRLFEGRYPSLNVDAAGQPLVMTGLRVVEAGDPAIVEVTEHSVVAGGTA